METGQVVIGDQTEQEKIEDERLFWSDLKNMENDVTNNLVINVLAVDSIKKTYTAVLKNNPVLNSKMDGLIKTYGDISKDVEESIALLAPKVYVGDIKRNEDNIITNARIEEKSDYDVVTDESVLDYLSIANKLNTAANELGTFTTEAYINLSAELGMTKIGDELKAAKDSTDASVIDVIKENTIKE